MQTDQMEAHKTLAGRAGKVQNEQWLRLETLFHQALQLAPKDRAEFLDAACGGDAVVLREVGSLLATHEAGSSLLDSPAADLAAEWAQANGPRPAAQNSQPELMPQTLGSYQILSPLGKGGMGEVYLAEDTRLRRKVALKLLPADFTNSRERLRRFEMEARAASATNHPNIITIYEIGRIDATHFISTEFVEGKTLRRIMNNWRLEVHEVLDIAVQVASALVAAHAAGIHHRDIKPENIMVRPDGLVKVLDFGLAKLADPPTILTDANATTAAEINTQPGVVMGTAQYMSPEQARGLPVDHRTDIFSLGVVLYEMVAGCAPFGGDALIEVMAAIAHRAPTSLTLLVPEMPARLEEIVNRALRKEPEQRYQHTAELLAELKDLKQELELEARLERITASGKHILVETPPASETPPNSSPPARTLREWVRNFLQPLIRHCTGRFRRKEDPKVSFTSREAKQ